MKVFYASVFRLFEPDDQYHLASWLFLKGLAVIYFIAFLSLAVQVDGLVGVNGILPAETFLNNLYANNGSDIVWRIPTLFWINASDFALQGAAYLGCFFAITLLLGYRQRLSLILMFVLYLSLYHVNQTFLNFQWDTLLMECGFLAIFLVSGPSNLVVFLFHWLLFRLRFMSGTSKLVTGDPSWSNFTSLNYYFETQPLPHIGSWYFHQLPEWLLKTGVGTTFFAELIVPFFIFLPRRFRIFAAIFTIFMQLLIIASSNHNFVNLLTIILCLFLLDDKLLQRFKWIKLKKSSLNFTDSRRITHLFTGFIAVAILFASLSLFYRMATNGKTIPAWVAQTGGLVRSYGLGHIYHVFPTMQTERHELEIEGSDDRVNWYAYQFKYKPSKLDKAPVLNTPHQPRLDWMIWFVPPKHSQQMYWFGEFMKKLRSGSEEVTSLLAYNPFEKQPPKHLRVLSYRYQFTTAEEREKTGNWWKREYLGEFPYVPARRP